MSDLVVELVEEDYVVEVNPDIIVEIGVPGPSGPAGPSGGTYEHLQLVPSDIWTINHNLNVLCPSVTVVDSDSPPRNLYAKVSYPNRNTAVVELASVSSGAATVG